MRKSPPEAPKMSMKVEDRGWVMEGKTSNNEGDGP